ncbi:MAG: threonine synthase [Chloroflexota bacterium]
MSQVTAVRPEPFVSEGSSPPAATPSGFQPGFTGLRCRSCGTPQETAALFVCPRCFGPLEPTYDLAGLRQRLTREAIEARPSGVWRFAELLPIEHLPSAPARVGDSPLVEVPRLAAAIGLDRLWVKDDSRNPTLSFKDRPVAIATARAIEFGFHTLACASTGNLAPAVAAAAAANGLRAVVFVPADLEAAKVAQARALGATVVRVDGPYDAVNRLCLELTDELEGWAVVNVNVRPYYAEGSKTIAFEIARQLGWRSPDVVVAPLASGSLYTKLAQAFDELTESGLVERGEVQFVGGQETGCAAIADALPPAPTWSAGRAPDRHRALAGHRVPGGRALRGASRAGVAGVTVRR